MKRGMSPQKMSTHFFLGGLFGGTVSEAQNRVMQSASLPNAMGYI